MESNKEVRNEACGGLKKVRKVQYGYYEDKTSKPHPVIRIAGKYLERFGFKIGDVVTVEIENGKIMVRRFFGSDGDYAKTGEVFQLTKLKEKSDV